MNRILLLVTLLTVVLCITSFAQLNIAIDGQKDDFYKTLTGPDDGHLWIPSAAGNDNGIPDDDWDLSAYLWSAWDETYFYVYEEVSDERVNQNNATNWQNDCLEIKIDPDPYNADGTVWATRLTALDSADVPENVWNGIDNLFAEAWATTERATRADYFKAETDSGYVLELRLKWDWIGTTLKGPVVPEAGTDFGLAYMNHDNDDAAREGSIEWATVLVDAVWNNCGNHGTVILLEGNKLQYLAENIRTGEAYPNPELWIPPGASSVSDRVAVARDYALHQNYPNPFNPATTIDYHVGLDAHVQIGVYNLRGQLIDMLVDRQQPPGTYSTQWRGIDLNGNDVPSGVYLVRMVSGPFERTRKMTLVR
ncbi:hypothetical protein A2V82_14705 [candidate division KSB1 bacterium RBG_16_48_16]|nr:MAG: hypothetical protein A2V82_14705 [candidate division KSB1 bacterium RBG_16_48_16]